MCTFDIDLQLIADKIVKEICLKLGKSQDFFGGNPELSLLAEVRKQNGYVTRQ